MSIFGDLSYKSKTLKPIGKPIDGLANLYAKKQQDYDYVVDTTNLIDTALSNVKYNEQDKEIVDNARNVFKDSIESFNVEGDLENRVLDTKKLSNDISNKFGLAAAQQDYEKRQNYISSLQERYDKGEIRKSDMDRAIAYSDRNNTGVQKDENGYYQSAFEGKGVLKDVDFAKEALDIAKGVKADTITGEDGKSYQIEKTSNGYINAVTGEGVSADKVTQITKGYLTANPDFNERVQEEVFYELDQLAQNGQELTVDNLSQLTGLNKKALETKYGTDVENLNLEAVYSDFRKEQMLTETIKPAVTKESYIKLKNDFKKDWMLADSMKKSTDEGIELARKYDTIQTYNTTDVLSTEDVRRTAQIHKEARQSLITLEEDLKIAQASNDPDEAKRVQASIDATMDTLRASSKNNDDVINSLPQIQSQVKSIVQNNGEPGTGILNMPVKGLDISEGALKNLVFEGLNGVEDSSLEQYIKLDENQVKIDFLKEQLSGDFVNRKTSTNMMLGTTDKETLFKALEQGDLETAFNQLSDQARGYAEEAFESQKKTSTYNLRAKVEELSNKLGKEVEDNEVTYNTNDTWLNLSDRSAAEKRDDAVYQLENQAQNITKNVNFAQSLSLVNSDESLINYLENEYNVENEDNEIDWKNAKLIPSFNTVKNKKTGKYDPALVLQVDVNIDGNKDKKKPIQLRVQTGDNSYNMLHGEAMTQYKNTLLNKQQSGNLKPREADILQRIKVNEFNSTKFGQQFDMLDLYNTKDGQVLETNVSDNLNAKIKTFKHGSPQNMSYYLIEEDGKTPKETIYYVQDNEGNVSTMDGETLKTSKTHKALGANSPYDLKVKISSMIPDENYSIDTNTTASLVPIFNQNIKEGVDARIASDVIPKVKALKDTFPNLFITDALRPENTEIGAETSLHKKAKALDLRLNEDSIKVANMTPAQKQAMGIKIAEVHEDHIHLEFI